MARTPAAPVRVEVKSLSVQSELHNCFFVLLHACKIFKNVSGTHKINLITIAEFYQNYKGIS